MISLMPPMPACAYTFVPSRISANGANGSAPCACACGAAPPASTAARGAAPAAAPVLSRCRRERRATALLLAACLALGGLRLLLRGGLLLRRRLFLGRRLRGLLLGLRRGFLRRLGLRGLGLRGHSLLLRRRTRRFGVAIRRQRARASARSAAARLAVELGRRLRAFEAGLAQIAQVAQRIVKMVVRQIHVVVEI